MTTEAQPQTRSPLAPVVTFGRMIKFEHDDLTGYGSLPLAYPGPPRSAWLSHAPLAPSRHVIRRLVP
jgi:hypothetical protein